MHRAPARSTSRSRCTSDATGYETSLRRLVVKDDAIVETERHPLYPGEDSIPCVTRALAARGNALARLCGSLGGREGRLVLYERGFEPHATISVPDADGRSTVLDSGGAWLLARSREERVLGLVSLTSRDVPSSMFWKCETIG